MAPAGIRRPPAAIAGQRTAHRVEGSKGATDARLIFQGVETGIDREGQPARVLKVIAELYAFVIGRADIAKRFIPVDAVHAQTHAAAFAADKPAVRKFVAHIATASGGTAIKDAYERWIRAARALLRWRAEDLAGHSALGVTTIRRAELAEKATSMTVSNDRAVQRALEAAGVEFIDENGGGAGVRLKKPRRTATAKK